MFTAEDQRMSSKTPNSLTARPTRFFDPMMISFYALDQYRFCAGLYFGHFYATVMKFTVNP